MAAVNSGSNNSNSTSAGGSNMYRVGDYVYFEAQQQQQQQQQQQSMHQQQQPFQIRRIEELNKTAGGNVEAKVMCFYRRRDLPAQLVALADKHQQHQQQQQLSLTLSLSPGGSSTIKGSGKQSSTIKSSSASDKDANTDKKEQDTIASGTLPIVKKEQQNEEQSASKIETSEINESVKEEEQQHQDVEMSEDMDTNSSVSAVVKSGDVRADGDEVETNDKSSDVVKDDDKAAQSIQPQHDWWRGEQLKQRELFLSRQVETLAATHIRGKCTVTLYNETESLDSYLEREDTFFYCLVFDPVQKTLLADKGEIRVGHKYQAEVPPKALFNRGSGDINAKDITATLVKGDIVKEENITDGDGEEPMVTECSRDDDDDDEKDVDAKSSTAVTTVTTIGTVTAVTMESDSELETLIWTCRPQWNRLTDRQIDQFLVVSRSLGTFARALDCTSSVKQPSLHMSAAAASRDITLFHAMDTLHRHGYDLGTATCSLVPSTGPVLCRDEMEEWSASEANLFEEALEKYGKDFGDIRHDFLPWKTHKNIVEYYYMWKTTDRYVQQKRVKAVEQESKLKQVYIPSYNGSTSGGKQQAITSGITIKSSQQQQLVNGNSAAVELYSPKNGSGGLSLAGEGPLQPGLCDLCDAVSSQQWYPNTIGATTGTTSISYHQQNGGLSSTLCHECWTHWKKYGGPRTATSDKKVIAAARGGSMSGDEDRPHSNASSSSLAAAMNLNVSAGGGRSSSHGPSMSTPPHHHHHLMHLGGSGSSHHSSYHQSQHHHHQQLHHQQQQQQQQQQLQQQHQSASSSPGGGGLLLHQPHINSSGSTTTAHRCTIIGCQAAPFKSKSQLLRHYSTAHGIGINSNSSSSPSAIITPIGSSRSSGSAGLDGGGSGKLSPQPPQQQQTISGAGLLHHNSGGPLNLNSSNPVQHSINSSSANQVINLIASSSSPQQQPNNLSTSGGGITTNTVIGTGGVTTATGRPVMKTRTAFYLRCTSLAKASRRRSAQQAAAALLQQQHHQKKASSSGSQTASVLSPIASAMVQPGCLARPRNVARRPFVCVPQTAHSYKHECMLSMQHAPVHELRAYLRAAAVKAHARRPGVTRVANALIAARRGRGGMNSAAAADIAVPDWLSLPSQQHQHQSSHHHVSSSSKHGKHSSRSSTGGRVAFPKPPKAPDGSLLYERVPNKQEAAAAAAAAASALNNPSAAAAAAAAAAAVGLNPAAAAAILGALGPPGSTSSGNSAGASGSTNDQSAAGFDVAAAAAALYQQQQQQQQLQGSSSSSNKRRLYETDSASIQQQPQPQAGPPSKRMHRQQHHSQQQQQQQQSSGHHHHSQQHQQPSSTSQGGSGAGGGAVDGMLASIVAHQQQQQQQRGSTSSGGPLQMTTTGSGGKSGGSASHHQSQQQHQQHNHYRTPSMARTGRKHVISWTDAPDDLYYRCTTLSRSLRKARMTGKELRRSARKPWQPIAALLGISFTMPSTAAASSSTTPLGTAGPTGSPGPQTNSTSGNPSSIGSATPFDMSTTGGGGASSSNRQPTTIPNPSAAPIVAPCISGALTMSSRSSGGGSSHH